MIDRNSVKVVLVERQRADAAVVSCHVNALIKRLVGAGGFDNKLRALTVGEVFYRLNRVGHGAVHRDIRADLSADLQL